MTTGTKREEKKPEKRVIQLGSESKGLFSKAVRINVKAPKARAKASPFKMDEDQMKIVARQLPQHSSTMKPVTTITFGPNIELDSKGFEILALILEQYPIEQVKFEGPQSVEALDRNVVWNNLVRSKHLQSIEVSGTDEATQKQFMPLTIQSRITQQPTLLWIYRLCRNLPKMIRFSTSVFAVVMALFIISNFIPGLNFIATPFTAVMLLATAVGVPFLVRMMTAVWDTFSRNHVIMQIENQILNSSHPSMPSIEQPNPSNGGGAKGSDLSKRVETDQASRSDNGSSVDPNKQPTVTTK